jgi:hypothetical protein
MGKKGGLNLLTFVLNNPIVLIDVKGMYPGRNKCNNPGQEVDDGWVLEAYYPSGLSSGGSTGAGIADYATCLFSRKKRTPYDCKCICPNNTVTKERIKTYTKTETIHTGPVLWQGFPGTWPPKGAVDIVLSLILELITAPVPDTDIGSQCEQYMPGDGETGAEKHDTGIPSRWCWL